MTYRWWYYTAGNKGPYGPVEATDERAARSIAAARCFDIGLKLEHVERVSPGGQG